MQFHLPFLKNHDPHIYTPHQEPRRHPRLGLPNLMDGPQCRDCTVSGAYLSQGPASLPGSHGVLGLGGISSGARVPAVKSEVSATAREIHSYDETLSAKDVERDESLPSMYHVYIHERVSATDLDSRARTCRKVILEIGDLYCRTTQKGSGTEAPT